MVVGRTCQPQYNPMEKLLISQIFIKSTIDQRSLKLGMAISRTIGIVQKFLLPYFHRRIALNHTKFSKSGLRVIHDNCMSLLHRSKCVAMVTIPFRWLFYFVNIVSGVTALNEIHTDTTQL